MTGITVGAREQEAALLREQLAAFRPLLTLSMVMTNTCDKSETLRIATAAIPSVGACRVEGIYFDEDWRSVGSVDRPADAECLEATHVCSPLRVVFDRHPPQGAWVKTAAPTRQNHAGALIRPARAARLVRHTKVAHQPD